MIIKIPRFCVGDKVEVQYIKQERSKCLKGYKPFKGKIVHIFEKFEIPSKKKIIKYYGKEIMNPKYGKVFGPMFESRVIVKNGKKSYSVLPMAGYNRYFTIRRIKK